MIPEGQITDRRPDNLLQVLAANDSLTEDEIHRCYLRGNVNAHLDLLDVHFTEFGYGRECEHGPCPIARLVDADGGAVAVR